MSVTPLPMSIIGVQDAGYTESGTWTASSVAGWLASKTRTSNAPTASAEWRPDLPTTGEYEVWAWVPNNRTPPTSRDTSDPASGSAVTEIDQTTGGARWISLGRIEFAAGTDGRGDHREREGKDYLRTNAVKFVPLH